MKDQTRLIFIDNIRILLILLVIAHHVGQAYGATGGWWAYQNPERVRALGLFFTVNRSFFMSLFFMISGYFMPSSFDRKGARGFLTDRFRRFGIPLLVFFFLIIPIEHYAYFLHFRPYGPISFTDYYQHYYFGAGPKPADWSGPAWPEMNFGHLWFIEHLLVFALGYTLLRKIRPLRVRPETPVPGHLPILLFSLAIALTSAVVRIWYPIDKWIGFLGFIQVAFADVPRDLGWFIIGAIAYRRNWLLRLETRTGMVWLALGLALAAAFYILAPLRLFPRELYPLWESLLCSGLCIGLPVLFRERLNFQNALAQSFAENTYSIYLFHVPVAVALQYAVGGLPLGPMARFLLVIVLAVPLTFGLSAGLRKLPGARSIL